MFRPHWYVGYMVAETKTFKDYHKAYVFYRYQASIYKEVTLYEVDELGEFVLDQN